MNSDDPSKFSELTPHQLIDEIRQVATQYAAEVPGTRRNWPESIRSRILALGRLGISKKKISDLTGIPAATVFLWCRDLPRAGRRSREKFIQLPSGANPTVRLPILTPTVGLEVKGTQGLSLRAPNGFLFEGIRSVEELARLYRELSG